MTDDAISWFNVGKLNAFEAVDQGGTELTVDEYFENLGDTLHGHGFGDQSPEATEARKGFAYGLDCHKVWYRPTGLY